MGVDGSRFYLAVSEQKSLYANLFSFTSSSCQPVILHPMEIH